jgi:PEP-CTERM motif
MPVSLSRLHRFPGTGVITSTSTVNHTGEGSEKFFHNFDIVRVFSKVQRRRKTEKIMRFRYFGLIGCIFCALPAAQAATILSENFNELTDQLSATSVGAFQTIGGTNVDIVGPGNGFASLCATPESGSCVDMDGSGGNSQGILQTVSSLMLLPGVDYFLSFDLIGSQRGTSASTTVTLGTSSCSGTGCLYNQTFNLASGDDTDGIVTNALVTVSAPTTAFLTFTSNTSGEVGDLLDNVLITTSTVTGSAPEPSSMILIGSALVGLSLLARRLHRV